MSVGRTLGATNLLETQPRVAFKEVTTEIHFDINSPHLKACLDFEAWIRQNGNSMPGLRDFRPPGSFKWKCGVGGKASCEPSRPEARQDTQPDLPAWPGCVREMLPVTERRAVAKTVRDDLGKESADSVPLKGCTVIGQPRTGCGESCGG